MGFAEVYLFAIQMRGFAEVCIYAYRNLCSTMLHQGQTAEKMFFIEFSYFKHKHFLKHHTELVQKIRKKRSPSVILQNIEGNNWTLLITLVVIGKSVQTSNRRPISVFHGSHAVVQPASERELTKTSKYKVLSLCCEGIIAVQP